MHMQLFYFNGFVNANGNESERDLAVPIGRRFLRNGAPHFVSALECIDPCNGLLDEWALDCYNLTEESRTYLESIIFTQFITRLGADACALNIENFHAMLDGKCPFSGINDAIDGIVGPKELVYCLLSIFGYLGCMFESDSPTQTTLRKMEMEGSMVQRAFARDLVADLPVLKTAGSFGWYVVRRVWFPAWRVQQYLWKSATVKRYAPGGFAQIAINAIEADDLVLADCAKRALEGELFKRAVVRSPAAITVRDCERISNEVAKLALELVGQKRP